MQEKLFIHEITITRDIKGTQNSLGEKTEITSTIYENIPVRIESNREKVEYRDSGQRTKNITIIYVPERFDQINRHDKIYQGSTFLGLVDAINPALAPMDG